MEKDPSKTRRDDDSRWTDTGPSLSVPAYDKAETWIGTAETPDEDPLGKSADFYMSLSLKYFMRWSLAGSKLGSA